MKQNKKTYITDPLFGRVGNTIKIVTHDREFNADLIFAIVILAHVQDSAAVYIDRISCPGDAYKHLDDSNVFVLDIGGKFEPEKNNFDDRGHNPFFSVSEACWEKFGMQVLNRYDCLRYFNDGPEKSRLIDKAHTIVKDRLIRDLKRGICSVETDCITVSDIIGSWNASSREKTTKLCAETENPDELFREACSVAEKIFSRIVEQACSTVDCYKAAKNIARQTKGPVLELPFSLGSDPELFQAIVEAEEEPKLLYVVSKVKEELWEARAIPVEVSDLEKPRKPFPREWVRTPSSEFAESTGILAAISCPSETLCFAYTREGAEILAETAARA